MYLLDTNVIIDYLKQAPDMPHFLDKHTDVFTSYVVVGELLQGVRDAKDLRQTQKLIDSLEVDFGSNSISRRAVQIMEKHVLKDGIGFLDALIAATALENEAILVTLNLKHFMCVPNLEVVSPR
jgi:predicted nucleic acid-binding protein